MVPGSFIVAFLCDVLWLRLLIKDVIEDLVWNLLVALLLELLDLGLSPELHVRHVLVLGVV